MKKIFLNLFVVAGLIFATSCSSDDDNGGNTNGDTATIAVDGNTLTFNSSVVQESGDTRTISFSNTSDPTTVLTFILELDATGTSVIEELSYFNNNQSFNYDAYLSVSSGDPNPNPQDLAASVQANSDTGFIAVVSGTLSRFNNGNYETVVLTNGTFNITY